MSFQIPNEKLQWSDIYAEKCFLQSNDELNKIGKSLQIWKNGLENVQDVKSFYVVNKDYALLYVNHDYKIELAHCVTIHNDKIYGIIGNEVTNNLVQLRIDWYIIHKFSLPNDECCNELDRYLKEIKPISGKRVKHNESSKQKRNKKTITRLPRKQFRSFMIVPPIFIKGLCQVSTTLSPMEIKSKVLDVLKVVEASEFINCNYIIQIKHYALWIIAWCFATSRMRSPKDPITFRPIFAFDVFDKSLSRRIVRHHLTDSSRKLIDALEKEQIDQNRNQKLVERDQVDQIEMQEEEWNENSKEDVQAKPTMSKIEEDVSLILSSLSSNQTMVKIAEKSKGIEEKLTSRVNQCVLSSRSNRAQSEFPASPANFNNNQVCGSPHQTFVLAESSVSCTKNLKIVAGTDPKSSLLDKEHSPCRNDIQLGTSQKSAPGNQTFRQNKIEKYFKQVVTEILGKYEFITQEQIFQDTNPRKDGLSETIEGIINEIKINWNGKIFRYFQTLDQQNAFWENVKHRVFHRLNYNSTECIDWSFLLQANRVLGHGENFPEYQNFLNEWDAYETPSQYVDQS